MKNEQRTPESEMRPDNQNSRKKIPARERHVEEWEADPEKWAEKVVQNFENMAGQIYQGNTARVCLDALKERVAITEAQKQRLLNACDLGMTTNPDGCKEWRQFQNFKKYRIPRLPITAK